MRHYAIYVQQETDEDRIDRLRQSLAWMMDYGTVLDQHKWIAILMKAERLYHLRQQEPLFPPDEFPGPEHA